MRLSFSNKQLAGLGAFVIVGGALGYSLTLVPGTTAQQEGPFPPFQMKYIREDVMSPDVSRRLTITLDYDSVRSWKQTIVDVDRSDGPDPILLGSSTEYDGSRLIKRYENHEPDTEIIEIEDDTPVAPERWLSGLPVSKNVAFETVFADRTREVYRQIKEIECAAEEASPAEVASEGEVVPAVAPPGAPDLCRGDATALWVQEITVDATTGIPTKVVETINGSVVFRASVLDLQLEEAE